MKIYGFCFAEKSEVFFCVIEMGELRCWVMSLPPFGVGNWRSLSFPPKFSFSPDLWRSLFWFLKDVEGCNLMTSSLSCLSVLCLFSFYDLLYWFLEKVLGSDDPVVVLVVCFVCSVPCPWPFVGHPLYDSWTFMYCMEVVVFMVSENVIDLIIFEMDWHLRKGHDLTKRNEKNENPKAEKEKCHSEPVKNTANSGLCLHNIKVINKGNQSRTSIITGKQEQNMAEVTELKQNCIITELGKEKSIVIMKSPNITNHNPILGEKKLNKKGRKFIKRRVNMIELQYERNKIHKVKKGARPIPTTSSILGKQDIPHRYPLVRRDIYLINQRFK